MNTDLQRSAYRWFWLLTFLFFLSLASVYVLIDPLSIVAQGTVPPGGTLPGGTIPPSPMVEPDFSFGTVHGLTLPDGPDQPAITLLIPDSQGVEWAALTTKGDELWGGVKTSCMEFGTMPTFAGIYGNTYFCELTAAASSVSAVLAGEPKEDPEPSLLFAGAYPESDEVEFWPNCSLWRQPSNDGKVQSCDVDWVSPADGQMVATFVVIGNDDDSRYLDYTLWVNGVEVKAVSYDDPTVGEQGTPAWDLGINATVLTAELRRDDEVTARVSSPAADGDSGYVPYIRLTLERPGFRIGKLRDRDMDTIPGIIEGDRDTDLDGLQDSLDPDADNDGIPDRVEVGFDPLNPQDKDGNGVPDYKQFGVPEGVLIYLPMIAR